MSEKEDHLYLANTKAAKPVTAKAAIVCPLGKLVLPVYNFIPSIKSTFSKRPTSLKYFPGRGQEKNFLVLKDIAGTNIAKTKTINACLIL